MSSEALKLDIQSALWDIGRSPLMAQIFGKRDSIFRKSLSSLITTLVKSPFRDNLFIVALH